MTYLYEHKINFIVDAAVTNVLRSAVAEGIEHKDILRALTCSALINSAIRNASSVVDEEVEKVLTEEAACVVDSAMHAISNHTLRCVDTQTQNG